MKTSSVAVIFATTLFIFIAGCASSPPPEPQEKIDANSTILFLNNKIPDLKKQIYDINKEIETAEAAKINVTEIKMFIQGNELKINDIEAGLNNAKAYFSNKNFVLANQTAHSAESNFNYLQENLNLAVDKLKEAYSKHAIQNAEMTLSDMKNQSKYFKDNVTIADNEGVNVANISKYIQVNEQYISTADANLNSAKLYLYTKNYDSIYLKINDTNNEIQIIKNNLNQDIKNLQDEYNRTIAFSQELLTQSEFEIKKAEIYLTDAQIAGANITKFQSRYEQARATSNEAHEALSARRFKAIKPKTDITINMAKEIESDAIDAKYDTISKNTINNLIGIVQGNEALYYIEKANESRLNKKYEETIMLVNKAVVTTSFSIIESEISDLDRFSTANHLKLNHDSFKNNIDNAKASLARNDIVNSLQLAKQINNQLKGSSDSINKFLDAKFQIENAQKTSLLWISVDTSQAEAYLNKSMEQIKLGNFDDAIDFSIQAIDSANKTESETRKNIDDNIILRLIKLVKGIVSKEQTSLKPEEIQFIDVSHLNLVDVKFTPPEVNIDPKSLRQTATSISFQSVSVNAPQTPSEMPDIEKTKVFSVGIGDMDYGSLRLGKPSNARIEIINDGTEIITKERIEVTAGKSFSIVGYKEMSQTFEYNDIINPNENRWFVQQFNLPTTQSGVSLTGNYDITVIVYVNDKYLKTWKGNIPLMS